MLLQNIVDASVTFIKDKIDKKIMGLVDSVISGQSEARNLPIAFLTFTVFFLFTVGLLAVLLGGCQKLK